MYFSDMMRLLTVEADLVASWFSMAELVANPV